MELADDGQQVTAWGFTQSEKMCILTYHRKLLDLAEAKSVRIAENTQKTVDTVPHPYFAL